MSYVAPHLNNLYFLTLCQRYGVYRVIRWLFMLKLGLGVAMLLAGADHVYLLCIFIARYTRPRPLTRQHLVFTSCVSNRVRQELKCQLSIFSAESNCDSVITSDWMSVSFSLLIYSGCYVFPFEDVSQLFPLLPRPLITLHFHWAVK